MKRTKKRTVIGYIRVSTVDQNTEKNEAAILKYANDKGFGQVEFVSEKVSGMTGWKNRKLADVVNKLHEGDILIVPELSRLGRSISNVLDVLNTLTDKGVKVYSVKENFQLNGTDIQSKVMRTMLSLFSEVENDIRTARIREGHAAAKAKGVKFGRPKGSGHSKLDPHKEAIIAELRAGVKKHYIANKFNVAAPTLSFWLKKNNLQNIRPE